VLKKYVPIPENTPPASSEPEVVNITAADVPAAAQKIKIRVKKPAAAKK
jgi:hypothetical protein